MRKWEQIESMNLARSHHTSEFLGNMIYVFCGFGNGLIQTVSSIERLNVIGFLQRWELILIDDGQFSGRSDFACSALNDHEIVILGGTTTSGSI